MKGIVFARPGPLWAYWLFAFAIKLTAFLFFAEQHAPDEFAQHRFYVVQGDAPGYLQPVENLLDRGVYVSDGGRYAQRMPGYAAVYLPLRALLPQQWAINLTLLLQVVLSALSCYALGLIAFMLVGSKRLFQMVFWGYALSTYVSIWDISILTESFATSALVIGSFFLMRGADRSRRADLFIAGLLMAWCIFLRPFMLPVLGLYALALLMVAKGATRTWKVLALLTFLGPFIVLDGLWTLRNWNVEGKLVPLQAGVTYNDGKPFSPGNPSRSDVSDLMRSFGADHCWWNPKEPAYAFVSKDAAFTPDEFPKELFSSDLTFEKLTGLRELSLEIESGTLSDSVSKLKTAELASGLRSFHDHYRNDHPFHYHIISRLVHLKRFLVHTGVYNIPFPSFAEQTLPMKAIKGVYALLYFIVMPIGFICCLTLFLVSFDLRSWHTYGYAVPLYLALFFPFVLKIHEFRFNTMCYPFLLIVICYLINSIWDRYSKSKKLLE